MLDNGGSQPNGFFRLELLVMPTGFWLGGRLKEWARTYALQRH
jgi:hypothetical protein